MIKKQYLKEGDLVNVTDAQLIWNPEKEMWEVELINGILSFDGYDVFFDKDNKPYIEIL